MKKITVFIAIVIMMASCKSKQAIVAEQDADQAKSVRDIIEGHYKNTKDYKTLYIKAGARYEDSRQTHNVAAEIRIKKDEAILVSIRILGITIAKALITPDKVTYYEKINSTYFDGNYAMLSRWLGTELDYAKVQAMLTGDAIYDLNKGAYTAKIQHGLYRLQSKPEDGLSKEFLFEGAGYLLKKQLVMQGGMEPRRLDIQYPAHAQHARAILPAEIRIEAEQKEKVNIRIEYNTVTFDENMSFPFSVPEGFEQIFID